LDFSFGRSKVWSITTGDLGGGSNVGRPAEGLSPAWFRAEVPGELVGDAVPRVGIGRRFALGDDVRPELGILAIEAEPM
jgi:hypothetical protein